MCAAVLACPLARLAVLATLPVLLAERAAAQESGKKLVVKAPSCKEPSSCVSGLWSDASCQCECIPPVCHNETGHCR